MKKALQTLKWIIPVCIIFFSSCIKNNINNSTPPPAPLTTPDVKTLLATNAPAAFNFETTSDVTFNVTVLAPDDTPIKNVLVSFLTKAEELGGLTIYKSVTDQNGKISGTIKLAPSFDQLIIDPKYAGIIRNAAFRVEGGNITCTLGGTEGYSGSLVLNSPLGGRLAENIKPNFQKILASPPFSYMGAYSNLGKPYYLETANDLIKAALLADVTAALPEQKPVPVYHPEYLAPTAQTNIKLVQTSDVYFTFISEGADFKNSIAYFTYPTNNPPKTSDDIDSLHIILPNASLIGSGGSIQPGNKVKLGNFAAGTSIGFALIANGWNGIDVTNSRWILYSLDYLNPPILPALQRHSVLLYDDPLSVFVVGFEDVRRDYGSDHDFNDCIFYVKSTVTDAISKENVVKLPLISTNPSSLNYINYFPCQSQMGTLAFEDNWPYFGDYDMNDVVVNFKYGIKYNYDNNAIGIAAQYVLKASGATYRNGFGVEFPFASSLVASAPGSLVNNNKIVTLGANGCEAGQTKAVIIPFDDAFTVLNVTTMFNTFSNFPMLKLDTININLTFTRPLLKSEVGLVPFNPFIFIDRTRGREVHLAGYKPTEKADFKYFKTGFDNTDPSKGIYYKSTSNLPWAMAFGDYFNYPAETKAINAAYPNFILWSQSNGLNYNNWYKDNTTSISANIYTP